MPVTTEQLTHELFTFLTATMKTAQGEVFRVVEELDLTMTQLKMLFVLDGADRELTPSELARAIGLSAAAAGRAVDALTRSGIVSRREDADDRRVKRLALTTAGQDAVARISAARRDGLAAFVEHLDPVQRDALSAALAPLLPTGAAPTCVTCAKEDLP